MHTRKWHEDPEFQEAESSIIDVLEQAFTTLSEYDVPGGLVDLIFKVTDDLATLQVAMSYDQGYAEAKADLQGKSPEARAEFNGALKRRQDANSPWPARTFEDGALHEEWAPQNVQDVDFEDVPEHRLKDFVKERRAA